MNRSTSRAITHSFPFRRLSSWLYISIHLPSITTPPPPPHHSLRQPRQLLTKIFVSPSLPQPKPFRSMTPAFVTLGASAFAPRLTPSLRPRRSCRHRHPRAHVPHSATSIIPNASQTSPTSSQSEFSNRFSSLRGKDVEPVSATIARFNAAFRRPVPIVYRAVINETLTTSHLATVCAMWRFDPIFAYGFDSIFSVFLRYYPEPEERQFLYKCCVEALGLDLELIQSTAESVAKWLEGKTQDDIFSAIKAASPGATAETVGPVVEAFAFIRDSGDFDWYYSRLFGIGLIQIMDAVGSELTISNAEVWAEAIGLEKSKFTSEMGTYLSSMERLKQAEQIFAEATAREAKKTAERLAAKAEAAAKEAEALEKEEVEEEEEASINQEEAKDESSTSA